MDSNPILLRVEKDDAKEREMETVPKEGSLLPALHWKHPPMLFGVKYYPRYLERGRANFFVLFLVWKHSAMRRNCKREVRLEST